MVSVAAAARPSSTRTSTLIRPAGVSRRTVVTGSVTGTMPVSTRTVATPIVPCPHIGNRPETSMNSTPYSASARVETVTAATRSAPWTSVTALRVRSRTPCRTSAARCAAASASLPGRAARAPGRRA
ncbi:hypothetical protein GCM10010341_90040 [Streptomyces noursei]|nr:hypothetical protein GCM10010341_90040 [Streptomyces noursei]